MLNVFCRTAVPAVVCVLATSGSSLAQCAVGDLVATNGATADFFGLGLSARGGVVAVGSPRDDQAAMDAGAAYVFLADGAGGWMHAAKLYASVPGVGDRFGSSVAVDDDCLIVGAIFADQPGAGDAGAAYFYRYEAGVWGFEQRITASDGLASDLFGVAVDVDGDWAVVGAWLHDHSMLTNAGAAYVFERVGNQWVERAKLTASDAEEFDQFGGAVAIRQDRVLVGARQAHAGKVAFAGAVYSFKREGGAWVEEHKFVPPDPTTGGTFGASVAFDGVRAVIGAPGDAPSGAATGAAYTFVLDMGAWVSEDTLTAPDGVGGDQFGRSVALEGGSVIVGAAFAKTGEQSGAGAAYLFDLDGGAWVFRDRMDRAGAAAANDQFGTRVAMAGDSAFVSAPHGAAPGVPDQGVVGVHLIGGPDCNENGRPDACDIAEGVSQDLNKDGVPDECQMTPTCPSDITGDGQVNASDLGRLLGSWGTDDPESDISGDGMVNASDLGLLLGAWGACP